MIVKVFYSPSFTGECYRDLPVNEPRFEKVVGDAGLLDFMELRLGLTGQEAPAIKRILAFQKAMETVKKDAFYEKAFENDQLATAKEILRWRDLLAMEGFDADADVKAPRLIKLAEVEREFRTAGLAGTPERWSQVLRHCKGKIPGVEIEVCHDARLLPRLIRDTLAATGVTKGRYEWDVKPGGKPGEKDLVKAPVWDPAGKVITIRYFGTVAEAYNWAVDNHEDKEKDVVVCPDPFRLNAVLRNREKRLLDASASGDSSVLQLFRLGLSLLDRPHPQVVDISTLLEYLRTGFSPIPVKFRNALARALKADGGRGEDWEEAIAKYGDAPEVQTFLLPLLNADIENGTVSASVVTDWCEALAQWSPAVVSKEMVAYRMELASLCDGLSQVIKSMASDKIEVKTVMKAVKTLYEPTPVQTDKAMAGGWNAVESHRCLIDAPESLLWLPCNGGLGTPYPYSFLLQEEVDELELKSQTEFIRYDFNLMVHQLGKVKTIVLCACDFDRNDALEEHPAVTLCKSAATEFPRPASGDTIASIFKPLGTLAIETEEDGRKTGVDLYPKRRNEKGEETDEDYPLSATGLETLIAYPFDYVMEKKLRFQDVTSLQLSDLTPTQGTVAHYVFEKMMEESGGSIPSMRAMLEKGFGDRVDSAAKTKGGILFRRENRTLFAHFKETIRISIGALLNILEKSGLTPVKCEHPLEDVELDFAKIKGSVDFYAETEKHQIVVIDFKYSKGKTYIEKLEDNKSIQLEIYAEGLEKELRRPVVAKGYYFFPLNQLHTDDLSDIFKGDEVVVHKVMEKGVPLAQRIRNSVDYRTKQLKEGTLEMEEGAELGKIAYHNDADDGKKMIDLPIAKKKRKSDADVKAASPFANPTKYPILKNAVK